jgi:hypothetical protein
VPSKREAEEDLTQKGRKWWEEGTGVEGLK